MTEKAPTALGDALRDLADVCDLNPDWSAVGCLYSLDGLRLNMHAIRGGLPVDVARAILEATIVDRGAEIEEAEFDKNIGFHDTEVD
jgi:hypothetical protein